MAQADIRERILALEQILISGKGYTMTELINALENRYGIKANRKVLYEDMKTLTTFYNLQLNNKGRIYYWQIVSF